MLLGGTTRGDFPSPDTTPIHYLRDPALRFGIPCPSSQRFPDSNPTLHRHHSQCLERLLLTNYGSSCRCLGANSTSSSRPANAFRTSSYRIRTTYSSSRSSNASRNSSSRFRLTCIFSRYGNGSRKRRSSCRRVHASRSSSYLLRTTRTPSAALAPPAAQSASVTQSAPATQPASANVSLAELDAYIRATAPTHPTRPITLAEVRARMIPWSTIKGTASE
jgi:hypothetical protein